MWQPKVLRDTLWDRKADKSQKRKPPRNLPASSTLWLAVEPSACASASPAPLWGAPLTQPLGSNKHYLSKAGKLSRRRSMSKKR